MDRRSELTAASHPAQAESQPLLEAVQIHKSFGGVHALKGVTLEIMRGEVHALVGENGAGKSTLIKVLTGALIPDSGEIRLRGQIVEHNSPAKARALGLSVIYQQPALFPDLTVAENISLANQGLHLWRKVNWRSKREYAASALERVGAHISPDALAGSLSMPEQQLVEIAKAIGTNAELLILDEPTASLGEEDTEHLFRILNQLRAQGTAIIYISHRFEELFRLADRVTVLRDGSSITTRPMAGITNEELIRLMIGRELQRVFPSRDSQPGEIVLEVRSLTSRAAGVRDISLEVRRGEIVGLAGLVGSGRTQVAETLFGLHALDGGEVLISGKPIDIHSPADAVANGVAYVPEDRRRHGVVLEMSVASNTTLANLDRMTHRGFLNFSSEQETAAAYIQQLGIKTPNASTPVKNLSGGNQQKVALARWLLTKPRILILDEPTQGIDVGAKAEIYHLMVRLAKEGMGVLMISSDMLEILGLSDRILVMAGGTLAGTLTREQATPYSVLALALGHSDQSTVGQPNESAS
jgi:rhamnose transport system ATP-binding protein